MYAAKVILDSITKRGHRLTTMQWTFPRFILAEVNTHRQFSRNSASSRAIPVETRLKQIESDPFIPEGFAKNQKGMQAGDELSDVDSAFARDAWTRAASFAVARARELAQASVHKQWANRVAETYAWHTAVITSTEWNNHDALRDHPAASPEYRKICALAKEARAASTPLELHDSQWHLPYVDGSDKESEDDYFAAQDHETKTGTPMLATLRKVSVGRCAAVSYERQEVRNFAKDIERYTTLRTSGHMSPFEHVARPMDSFEYKHLFSQMQVAWNEKEECWEWVGRGLGNGNDPTSIDGNYTHFCGNIQGWIQERKLIPNEHDFSKVLKA
jgi:hypothetical protein